MKYNTNPNYLAVFSKANYISFMGNVLRVGWKHHNGNNTVGDMLKTVYIDRTSYIDRFVYMLTIGNSQTQIVLSCFI